MLRMIIVDDEPIVRDTIKNIIDWKAHDVEVLCACKDGIEAYNAILDEYPDLVLLDINIPGINGLDLIQKIQSIDASISFVIISGYERFEYAKRALQYGVSEYLLKPCSKQEILSAVELVKRKRAERESISEMRRMNVLLKQEVQTAIQMQFLSDAFFSSDNIETLAASYADAISCGAAGYASLYLIHHQGRLSPSAVDRIAETLEEYPSPSYFRILSAHNIAVVAVAVTASDRFDAFRMAMESAAGETLGDYSLSAAHYPDMDSLLRSLIPELKMVGRVEQLWKNGFRRLLYAPELHTAESGSPHLSDWKDCLEASRQERDSEIARQFQAIYNVESAQTLATRMIYRLLPHLAAYRKSEIAAVLTKIYSSDSITDIQLQVSEFLSSLCEFHRQASEKNDFTHKIIRYIDDNIADPDLSLKWIAENVLYMNVNYVSKQFFKRTGIKFSSCLTDTRLKRALSIMNANPQIKVSEVAEAVGLGDNPQYFSQIFKKQTGCSPSQYLLALGQKSPE